MTDGASLASDGPVTGFATPSAATGRPREDSAALLIGRWRGPKAALQLGLIAALAAGATSGWVRLEEGRRPLVAVALGSVGPPALALGASALRRRTWPVWIAVVGHVGLLALLAAAVAGGVGGATSALTGGWARLLSTILPAASGSEVAVLALMVAGGASAVGAELALRSRAVVAPAAPAVLALIGTRMATQGVAESRLTGAAVVVVLLAGALALTRAGVLRPAVGLSLVLGAALAAATIGPSLPWAEARPPFDPRALRTLPPVEAGAVSPLSRLRAWQAAPDRVLFRARLSGRTTLRLAVLDRYDGVRFDAAPQLSVVGSALPPAPRSDPGAGAPTRTVTSDLSIDALDGPWLPVPDRATRVTGPTVEVDPSTGVVIAAGGLQPRQRYHVEAAVPVDQLAQLAGAVAASPAQVGPAASAIPPGMPQALADLATDTAIDAGDAPLVRLGRLQALFRNEFRADPASPPGHSLARLTAFLDPLGTRTGSTEQLATAFALLARSIGYPTRVAVGFRPAGPGEVDVHGADAQAWPEVALTGAGWVAFDPVPFRGAASGVDRRPPEAEAAAAAAAAPTPSSPSTPGPATLPTVSQPHRNWSWRPAGAAVAVIVVLLGLGLGVVLGSKRRRRRGRRGASDPVARVRGAWAEACDRLVERGLRRPPSGTPRDAATAIAGVSRAAAAPLADLGQLAERAAFAGPGAVADPDADRAWADLDLLEAALGAGDSRLTSIRFVLDPRPLVSRQA